MNAKEIKVLMINRIKENGLPFQCQMILENMYYGFLINKDSSLSSIPKVLFPYEEEENLEQLSIRDLGMVLEFQEGKWKK